MDFFCLENTKPRDMSEKHFIAGDTLCNIKNQDITIKGYHAHILSFLSCLNLNTSHCETYQI